MTPPEAPEAGNHAPPPDQPPAVLPCLPLAILTKRADFLAASRARRASSEGMMLQGRKRAQTEPAQGIRVGFTCTKKVGNAVARNRAKRRLREVARMILPAEGRAGWDYVLIGRAEKTAARDFEALKADLRHALRRVHPS